MTINELVAWADKYGVSKDVPLEVLRPREMSTNDLPYGHDEISMPYTITVNEECKSIRLCYDSKYQEKW